MMPNKMSGLIVDTVEQKKDRMTANELTFCLQGDDGASSSVHGLVWKINQQFPEICTVLYCTVQSILAFFANTVCRWCTRTEKFYSQIHFQPEVFHPISTICNENRQNRGYKTKMI
jgi:hypothetical protein